MVLHCKYFKFSKPIVIIQYSCCQALGFLFEQFPKITNFSVIIPFERLLEIQGNPRSWRRIFGESFIERFVKVVVRLLQTFFKKFPFQVTRKLHRHESQINRRLLAIHIRDQILAELDRVCTQTHGPLEPLLAPESLSHEIQDGSSTQLVGSIGYVDLVIVKKFL